MRPISGLRKDRTLADAGPPQLAHAVWPTITGGGCAGPDANHLGNVGTGTYPELARRVAGTRLAGAEAIRGRIGKALLRRAATPGRAARTFLRTAGAQSLRPSR